MFTVQWWKILLKSSWKSAEYFSADREGYVKNFLRISFLWFGFLMLLFFATTTMAEQKIHFNIPSQRADQSLTTFAQQANLTLIIPFDVVRIKTANDLVGEFSIEEAIDILLKETGLSATISEKKQLKIFVADSSEGKIMNKKPIKSGGLMAFMASLFAAIPLANAQGEKGDESSFRTFAIEEVVVTAQRRSENLQDVPIAVSAFTATRLDAFGIKDSQTLQDVTPGLVINNTGANSQPFLRGVGTRVATAGLDLSVATYSDDLYASRSQASIFEFMDVERVEVLKGPQGTLFGRNATGGAIRIITKGVEEKLGGYIKTSLGNYDYISITGVVNIPFSENFGGRFSAMQKKRDGFANNLVSGPLDEVDDQDNTQIRGKLMWDISESLTAKLAVDYSKNQDSRGLDVVILSPENYNLGIIRGGVAGFDRDETATLIGQHDNEVLSSQVRLEAAMGRYDVVWISTYADYSLSNLIEVDGTSLAMLDVEATRDEAKDTSHEIQILSEKGADIEWVVGANYFLSDLEYDSRINATALNGLKISSGLAVIDTVAWSMFGQATWHLNGNWDLVLGGRYSYEEKELDHSASQQAPVTTAPPVMITTDWNEFTPKVLLQYNFTNGMAYLSYSRGFKSGGYNYPASSPGQKVLEPEILDSYELGWKSDFFADSLRFNGAFYYYDYQDLQVTRAATSGAVTVIQNASNAEILGLDLDLEWILTNQLSLIAGLNFSDSEYKDYAGATVKAFEGNAGVADLPFDADGLSLLRTPEFSGFISVNYEFLAADASLPLSITYTYKDKYNFDFIYSSEERELQQDAYGLLNARLGYLRSGAPWEVFLWINNLTDEEYFDDKVLNTIGMRGSYGTPRTYGLDVTFSF